MNDQAWGWWRHAAAASPGAPLPVAAPVAVSQGTLPFRALVAFTVLLLLAPQSFIPALGALHLPLLSALLAVGSYVVGRWKRHEPVLNLGPEVRIAVLLAAWALITTPLSLWPGGSIVFFFSFFFKALVIFWLITNVVDSVPRLTTIAWVLSLVAVPLSAVAVKHFLGGGFQAEAQSHGLQRISGYDASLTANPNDLALMLNLILPLTLTLFLRVRGIAPRAVLAATAGLIVIAIIATFSRAGFLTLGVIVMSYLVILFKSRRRALAFAIVGVGLMGMAFLPAAYVERLSTITNIQADQTNSAQDRLRDTIVAAEYAAAHPLMGAGIGENILALNAERGANWTEVHNIYLVQAVELGLPGLILFLLLLRGVVRRVRGALRKVPPDSMLYGLLQGLGVSLLAFVLSAFFYPDAYQFYFYYIAGLALAAAALASVTGKDGIPMEAAA